MTEIEAKVSYVKLARSLKTYGVSFFLVKVRNVLYNCPLTIRPAYSLISALFTPLVALILL